MKTAITDTDLLNDILSSIKADKKNVSQISIKIIRGESMVCAAGDYHIIKPGFDLGELSEQRSFNVNE